MQSGLYADIVHPSPIGEHSTPCAWRHLCKTQDGQRAVTMGRVQPERGDGKPERWIAYPTFTSAGGYNLNTGLFFYTTGGVDVRTSNTIRLSLLAFALIGCVGYFSDLWAYPTTRSHHTCVRFAHSEANGAADCFTKRQAEHRSTTFSPGVLAVSGHNSRYIDSGSGRGDDTDVVFASASTLNSGVINLTTGRVRRLKCCYCNSWHVWTKHAE